MKEKRRKNFSKKGKKALDKPLKVYKLYKSPENGSTLKTEQEPRKSECAGEICLKRKTESK